ncbi:MAG TPA: alpha-L-fucosidase [Phycisphaerae bacterium]|nr:alpha-L-fucosidase [Phycisphaerae bacterium]
MRHRLTLGIAALLAPLLASSVTAQTTTPDYTIPAQPRRPQSPETPQHAARIGWWRQAKFGMFIHWGIYSVPAGVYKGEDVKGIGEWIMNHAKIPVKDYEKYAADFNPTKFDADAWAQLAQDAGMKYLVITAKHHDGFAMFKSEASPYNIVDATPFHRDPMKELAAACAKRGIRFGFYYSQAQDWHEPNGIGNTWDFGPDDKKDFEQYFQDKCIPQVTEILSNYGPIALVWFDTPRNVMTPERAGKLEKLVHTLQPNCLVSGRIGQGSKSDYDSEGDNHIPPTVRTGDWETPATLNDTWGYKAHDHNWKKPEDLVFKLTDIVSKGGNYLLNVGPTAEGEIPPESQQILHEVGIWTKANGEAIYGAGVTPFGAEFGKPSGKNDSRGRPIYDAPKDWRCTTKPGKLYFSVFNWPTDGKFLTPPITDKVKGAYLLADPDHKPLAIENTDKGLSISVPEKGLTPYATVIVVETE